jgi:CDP-glycerol glycerophosphotransferase
MNKFVRCCFEGGILRNVIQSTDNRQLRRILKLANLPIGAFTRNIYSKKIKVQSNKIMFTTYQSDYLDNQKYIAEELLRRNEKLDIVFSVSKDVMSEHEYIPDNIRLVERDSAEFFYEIMSSKVLVDNAFVSYWLDVPKINNQYHINTWHGSMGLKRIDKNSMKKRYWNRIASKADQFTDFMISNSQFENDVYRTTHWPTTKILQYGHPRNDILINQNNEEKREVLNKIYNYFNIDDSFQIALYAPTFRRNDGDIDCYDIDYQRLNQSLVERFGGKWVILVRHHFHNKKRDILNFKENQNILDASQYPDMQELLIASDVGISDYSSWVCDFVLTRKPIFLFTVDLEAYEKDRGFYYPLTDTPFAICKNNDELNSAILNFNADLYDVNINKYLSMLGCIENGDASKRVADLIIKLTKDEKIDD